MLSNYVRNALTYDTVRTARDGFGKPLVLSEHANFAELSRTFTERQALIDMGFSASGTVVGMFDALMGQELRPRSVAVGRRVAEVAQVETFTVGGSADGDYVHPVGDGEASFTAAGNTDTEIRDGIVAALNALDEPVTAAPVAATQYTVTADVSGVAFLTGTLVAPGDALTGVETTANVGVATDLQDIWGYDRSWYAALSDNRTTPHILEAAGWMQTARGIFVAQSNEADMLDPAVDTDVASQLLALQRNRTMCLYKSSDAHFFDAAYLGAQLPKVPGSTNWAWQPLAGVIADDLTETEVEALRAKRAGHLITMGALPTAFEGKMSAAGMWVDLIRGGDKIDNDIEVGKLDLLQGADKIGFDELQLLADRVELEVGRSATAGFVIEDSIEVALPEDIPESDISARRVLGITWKASIRTPVNEVETTGNLTISGVV